MREGRRTEEPGVEHGLTSSSAGPVDRVLTNLKGNRTMDMKKMMKQAQKMQMELARAQEEIKDMTFEATAGGGMVKVVATGDMAISSITIDPEAVDPEDVEMLQDMVTAAVNEALRGVSDMSATRLNAATGGMSIPGLM